MKMVARGIWEWSWFSEEKHIEFNGHLLCIAECRILVDPPPLPTLELEHIRREGAIDSILITNRDHVREALAYQQEFQCQVFVPERDADEMNIQTSQTFRDGDVLPGGLRVINVFGQKSPGESALFLQQEKGMVIVGDALLGKPAGMVSLLPPEKYADIHVAREGLRQLLHYEFDTLLVGDGVSLMTNAHQIVEDALR